jgi:hypothetical protein
MDKNEYMYNIPIDPEESLHFSSYSVLQHILLPKYEL